MPRDKKTGRIFEAKDQSFEGGFSITMDTYRAGNIPAGRKTMRFEHADELAEWVNQNKFKGKRKARKNKTSQPKRNG